MSARRPVGRPSKAEPFRTMLRAWLVGEPELRSSELLGRVKAAGYTGEKSALYDLVRELRPPRASLVARYDGLPGEVSQHDVAQVFVRTVSGTTRRVRFLVSRLAYSRWTEVSLLPDDAPETVIRGLLAHFEAMGGVPQMAVFDNPRTPLCWRGGGDTIEWHPTWVAVAADLGVELDLCTGRTREPSCCGDPVAAGVRNGFFKAFTFAGMAELPSRLGQWLEKVNSASGSRLFEERGRLRPIGGGARLPV